MERVKSRDKSLPHLVCCPISLHIENSSLFSTVHKKKENCNSSTKHLCFAFCMLEQVIKTCVRLNVNAFMANWHILSNVYFCNFILLYSLLILHSEGEKGSFSADLMKTLPWQMRNQPVCSGVWLKRMLIFCLNTAFKEIIQGSLWHGTQWPASKC